MAKLKTKRVGYDREATEGIPGVWTWSTGVCRWIFTGERGLNLGRLIDDSPVPLAFAKSLAEAGTFAEGYEYGWVGAGGEG